MTTLTTQQQKALRKVIQCVLNLWGAGDDAEELLRQDINTSGNRLWDFCIGVSDPNKVTEEELIEIFELDKQRTEE